MLLKKSSFLMVLASALLLAQPILAETKPASTICKKDLQLLIKNAKTQQDHERLSAYYRAEAQRFEGKRAEHAQMAKDYADNPMSHRPTKWPAPAQHCQELVDKYAEASETATALADYHERMASDVAKEGPPQQSPK